MGRPSRNQDIALIETAKRLLAEHALSDLSLKRIAAESGVNQGMFHYFFKTKDAFVRRVIESVHDELVAEMSQSIAPNASPLARLRACFIAVACGVRKRRKMVASLVQDVLRGDEATSALFAELTAKRVAILAPLVEACRADGSIDPDIPFYQILSFCMAGINLPVVVAESLSRMPKKELRLPALMGEQLCCDEAIAQRVDFALRALRPEKPAPRTKRTRAVTRRIRHA